MKTINAGSFFLLVFICFFEMMKPLCSPPLRLSLPFFFYFSLLYSALSFSLLPSFLPSLSHIYFSCVSPLFCSSLFPLCFLPFLMAPLCFFVFSFPFCLLSLSSPFLFFFCSSVSPLFYLSILLCFLTVTSPLSFLFSSYVRLLLWLL